MRIARRAQVPPFAVMQVLAEANARRAAGEDVISLCAGQPSDGAPRAVRDAARAILADGDLGYTEAIGVPGLRLAIAEHYGRRYDVDVDPGRVAITTGSSGAFLLTFLTAFEPGDRVALPRPGYPAYRNILVSLGVEVVDLPCGPESGFRPTTSHLRAAYYDGGLDGLVLASPANPTGTMVDAAELDALVRWCAEHDVRLVSDEIYHGIVYGEGAADDGSRDRQATAARYGTEGAVVVSSFSKYWGMTGWRLGWAVLPPDLVPPVDALAGNLALCPPAVAQHAALAAFGEDAEAEAEERVRGFAATRRRLLERLPELGWEVAPPDGAFYLYADVGTDDSVAWCERLLAETGVALTPGTDFDPVDGHRFVRLSFAASPAEVDEAVTRIVAWQRRG